MQVNGIVLRKVVEWCQHHRDDPDSQDPGLGAKLENLEAWDEEFMNVDQATLLEIILV